MDILVLDREVEKGKNILEVLNSFFFSSELNIIHRDKVFLGEVKDCDGFLIIVFDYNFFKEMIKQVESFCLKNRIYFDLLIVVDLFKEIDMDTKIKKDVLSTTMYNQKEFKTKVEEKIYQFMIKTLLKKYYP